MSKPSHVTTKDLAFDLGTACDRDIEREGNRPSPPNAVIVGAEHRR